MKPFSYRQIAFWAIPCALLINLPQLRAANLSILQVAGAPAGWVTNDLRVSTSAGEAIGAMNMWLRGPGPFIFQHPNGGDTPPDPLLLPFYPTLPFDSYVSDTPLGASQGLGSPNSGGPPVINTSTFDALWAPPLGQDNQNPTIRTVARLTLANTSTGLMSFALDSATLPDIRAEFAVRNGVIELVPEPESILIIAMSFAGVCCFTRRR